MTNVEREQRKLKRQRKELNALQKELQEYWNTFNEANEQIELSGAIIYLLRQKQEEGYDVDYFLDEVEEYQFQQEHDKEFADEDRMACEKEIEELEDDIRDTKEMLVAARKAAKVKKKKAKVRK